MIQRRGRLGFLDEPLLPLGIGDPLRRQDLDGDQAVQVGVPGLIDDPHAALAQLLEDLVVADGLANHGRPPGRRIGPARLPCGSIVPSFASQASLLPFPGRG
jgi:hypothetical protein